LFYPHKPIVRMSTFDAKESVKIVIQRLIDALRENGFPTFIAVAGREVPHTNTSKGLYTFTVSCTSPISSKVIEKRCIEIALEANLKVDPIISFDSTNSVIYISFKIETIQQLKQETKTKVLCSVSAVGVIIALCVVAALAAVIALKWETVLMLYSVLQAQNFE
jgi:hypothetical protein